MSNVSNVVLNMVRKASGKKVSNPPEEIDKPAPPVSPTPPAEIEPVPQEPKMKAPRAAKGTKSESEPSSPPARRKRGDADGGTPPRAKSPRGSRSKSFGFDDELMADYVSDDDLGGEEIDQELSLEPMELPLELLDPELVEVPRPAAAPKSKPKPVTNRRLQTCSNCHNAFPWVSVEGLCFNCLKKKLSQRKREDETYPGFTGEPEDEEEAS